MKQMTKRVFALLLSLAMVLQLCPFTPVTKAKADDDYELKVLTFEDADFQGADYLGESASYWSDLIDDPQYGGTLLYGDAGVGMDDPYWWWDAGNTNLYHEMPSAGEDNWGAEYCYWSYGEAISNYASGNIEECGDYQHQLTVYKAGEDEIVRSGGGHNGSDNFCVHYGYADTSGYGLNKSHLPALSFLNPETGEYDSNVIDGMWIKLTPYLLQCIVDGNDLTASMGENDTLYVKAYGFNAAGREISNTEMEICHGQNLIVRDWTYWDLSSLGSVATVKFEINGSSDNGYGFSQPAYFAFDDVTVRVPLPAEQHELVKTEAVDAVNCITPGNTEYYTCSDCGKYFADEDASEEIEEGSWVTTAPAVHATAVVSHRALPATCVTDGNEKYYSCESCNKFFSDKAGTKEIEEGSWVLPATGQHNPQMRLVKYVDKGDGTHDYLELCRFCQEYAFVRENNAHQDQNNDGVCDDCKAEMPGPAHELTKVEAKDAVDCITPGNTEYYSCAECGKFFADEDASEEIEEGSWVTTAPDVHATALVYHKKTSASCAKEGNTKYYQCESCGKAYSDAEGTTEIEEGSWILPKLTTHPNNPQIYEQKYDDLGDGTHSSYRLCHICGENWAVETQDHVDEDKNLICDQCGAELPGPEHVLKHYAAKPATCKAEGRNAYYACTVEGCGKFFADEDATEEIEENSWVIPKSTTHPNNVQLYEQKYDDLGDGTHSSYRICSVCGENWAVETQDHVDADQDDKCDLCNAMLACPDTDHDGFCDLDGEYLGDEKTEILPAKLVIPEGATATFYANYDGTGFPIAAKDLGVDEKNAQVHRYELDVPYGKYSCVVTDEDHNYGGVGFEFPLQTSIYEESNLTMVLVKHYTTTTSVKVDGVATPVEIKNVDDFNVNMVAPGKANVIPGENYLDDTIKADTTYVVAPRMVWAYGNQILYNYTVDLNGELADTFGVTPTINGTFASTLTSVQKKTFTIKALSYCTVTAPTSADTRFFLQINNFNDQELKGDKVVTSVDNEDGTTTYTCHYPDFANVTYRVSQEGYVTAAGYGKNATAYTVNLREDPDGSLAKSTETNIASKVGAGSNIEYENSVYLNVDDTKDTNELALKVGDTFRLRGFRAAWEIVNTVTANIMIEPDFHYAVLSGEDVVSVTPVTTQCTGNAKDNWMDLKALKEGTAVIAVWYDAIDVNGNTTLNGTYGATDPARYGYVVVNVGKDDTVKWNPVSFDGDWDAEFDTCYYFGDQGTFTMKPEGAVSVTVQNLNAAVAGEAQTVSAEEDGSYKVPVLTGSNLITVNTEDGKDYMLVRAKKIAYSIENKTTGKTSADADFVITKGDDICIHFDQFNMPVSKMSGIYNPGYMGTAKTYYTLNGKYALSSVGTQYDFITDTKSCINMTALIPGENKLTGGYIQSGSMGDNFGNHRNITDAGRGTNFSAVNVTGYFGSIEDISFQVEDSEDASVDYNSLVALNKGNIFVGESTYNHAGSYSLSSSTKTNNSTKWTKTTAVMESQPQNFSLKANVATKGYYTTMQLRYWYEGEEVHTTDMVAGTDTIIPWSEFPHDANKILNVEVVVTPGDPAIGPAKVYSFLWLPGNADLKYVHPVLSKLTATADGKALALTPEVQFTQMEYSLDVADKTVIDLAGSQLQQFTNKTNNKQDNSDTVIVTRMKDGQALDEGTSVLPLTADKYPVGSWTLNNLDISEADALQIQVISYVDSKYSRTYNIALEKAQVHVHTEEIIEGKDATCTEAGLTEGKKCSECEEILVEQEEIPALGHDYGDWEVVTEASYEADGLKRKTCSRCDDAQEEIIPMYMPVTIVTQPETFVGKLGETAVFTVEAAGKDLSYQWYYSRNGVKWDLSTVEGAKTESISLKLTEARDGQMYKCVITDAGNNEVTTDVVTMNKRSSGLVITTQPADQTANIGETVTFSVVAEGSGLTYQWYYCQDGQKWCKSGMEGATTASMKVSVIARRFNQQYRCVVTDEDGNEVTSAAATILERVEQSVVITKQPESANVSAGTEVEFSVAADGSDLTYQWYYSKDGENWIKSGMTGSTTDTIHVVATTGRNGQLYRCKVTAANGKSAVSEAAQLQLAGK